MTRILYEGILMIDPDHLTGYWWEIHYNNIQVHCVKTYKYRKTCQNNAIKWAKKSLPFVRIKIIYN